MKKIQLLLMLLSILSIHLYCLQEGERLVFDVKYGFISAAEAVMQIQSIEYEGKTPALKFISETKTYSFFDAIFKVRDKIESVWDKDKNVSLRFTKQLNEGRYKQYRIHTYNPVDNTSIYSRYNHTRKDFSEVKMGIPEKTQDILSAFYWMRTQKLEVGKNLEVNVTADGESHIARILILRKETISTIFGKTDCLVIKPELKGEAIFKQSGDIIIWVTNDEYKIPVRMESKVVFGSFKAILQSAQNVPYKVKK